MPPLFFCLILIVLNILDLITTIYGLSIGRTELNHYFYPSGQSMPIKIALPILYLLIFHITDRFCHTKGYKLGLKILKGNILFVVLIYFGLIINNLIVIFWGML